MTNTPNPTEEDRERDGVKQVTTSSPDAAHAISSENQEEHFYDFEEEDELTDLSSPFDVSFQLSGAMPAVSPQIQSQSKTATNASSTFPLKASDMTRTRQFPLPRVLLLSAIIVAVLAALTVTVFAQTTPLVTRKTATLPVSGTGTRERQNSNTPAASASSGKANTSPTPTAMTAQGTPSLQWIPQTLPAGWVAAGLSVTDALSAERTAWTFTDREMSLDYRSAGTRAFHAGTFTAAVFLLTPAARNRFAQNDLRAVNNALYDSVEQRQLIQEVVNAEPHLVAFQKQGQQQFAWVDISFQLWQSQRDPQHAGQRVEGLEVDPTTKQPRVHHMVILLLRVQPGTQGSNPPMGGTSWLVSTYALDPGNALPAIVLPA